MSRGVGRSAVLSRAVGLSSGIMFFNARGTRRERQSRYALARGRLCFIFLCARGFLRFARTLNLRLAAYLPHCVVATAVCVCVYSVRGWKAFDTYGERSPGDV